MPTDQDPLADATTEARIWKVARYVQAQALRRQAADLNKQAEELEALT